MISPVLPVYSRSKLTIERGEGVYLHTADGKRYMDFVSGVAVNCLGHCHPVLIDALQEQSQKLWHVSNFFQIPGLEEFASQLTKNTFADNVFFTNSGAEAIECCIKMVRKYHDATGNPDKYKIITFGGAFHGRTLAALWASKRDALMQEGFGPPVEGFENVPFGDLDAVKAAIDDKTAAILVEPVQGDGGIRPSSPEFLQGLRDLADEHGLLLCFDEIQCGMGRTGSLYAYMDYDITPDLMSSAKGIGGGFPLGACLASEKASIGMTLGTHGSTYGGNPLAMAVGSAVLKEVLRDGFLENVKTQGSALKKGLETLAHKYPSVISDVRGTGLILGIQTIPSNKEFISKLSDAGLLAPPAAENVVRVLPPLIIEQVHVDEALAIIDTVCAEYV